MIKPVIVLISKYTTIASMLLQFTQTTYPQLKIEVADEPENVQEIIPFRVIAVIEEEVCGRMLMSSIFPGKLRLVRKDHVLSDFDEILRSEGIERAQREE